MPRDPQMFWEGEPNDSRCPYCGRASDRLATLMELKRFEINEALGLDRQATHEKAMQRIAALKEPPA